MEALWHTLLHPDWHAMFVPDVTLAEKILRPILVYIFLIVGLRLAGKRELAQLNPFDFIVLMTLSNTVQNAIIGNDNSVSGGMLGAATLLAVNYGVVRLVRNHRKLQRALEGRADVLLRNGQIIKDHCDREMITKADLTAAAHKQGIASLHDVDYAVLEPTGTISFIQKRPTPESSRHAELMTMLQKITAELDEIRGTRPREEKAGS
ncbi:MAG TPA: YetF domain-containing protein [Tepidisphaeraceae bacterium]|jgi:uncharacterized membrane protein YcaP (DUF421 family)